MTTTDLSEIQIMALALVLVLAVALQRLSHRLHCQAALSACPAHRPTISQLRAAS